MEYHNILLIEWENGGYILWNIPWVKYFLYGHRRKMDVNESPILTNDKHPFNRAKDVATDVRVEYKFNFSNDLCIKE